MTEKNNCLQYEYEVHNVVDDDNEIDDDTNVEYIEYNNDPIDIIYDDDGMCIENDIKQNIEVNESNSTEIFQHITKLINSDDDAKIYYCDTCNLNFKNVDEHIENFHLNQSVAIANMPPDYGEENSFLDIDSSKSSIENISELTDEYQIDVANNIDKTDAKEFLCKQCDLVFSEEIHFKNHNNTKHINMDCANDDETEVVLIESLAVSIHKKKNESTECLICNKIFPSAKSLKLHARMHNPLKKSMEVKKSQDDENTQCLICNTVFVSARSLKLHARMHKPIELKNYKEALGHEYKKHFKNIQYFKCDMCNKRFDCKLREEHKKFHQNDKKLNEFVCTKCNKKFLNETSFKMHLKLHESQTDKPKKPTKAEAAGISLPYACQYCGREFGRPHEKVKHERIHTGEKPFKCEICGKCFRVTYSLTLHLRTHTAARPYVCSICNKRFKSYSVYSHHLLTHSDERPYKCPDCPKTFKTPVQLHGHKNSHTKPFNCPDCNRPFATMYAVKTHMETHKNTNLKQHCLICGATYSRTFALEDHMREVHSNNFVISEENEIKIKSDNGGEDIDDDNDGNNIIIEETETVLIEEEHTGMYDDEIAEEVVTDWLK